MDNVAIIAALARVAAIISPNHAKAVSEYLMDTVGMDCTCDDCADVTMATIIGLCIELDKLSMHAEKSGLAMRIVPMGEEEAALNDVVAQEVLGPVKMIDGMFC